MEWAKAYKDWTKKEWEDALWNDESKHIFFVTGGLEWIRHLLGTCFDPKYQIQTMKQESRNIMVWGCASRLSMDPLK